MSQKIFKYPGRIFLFAAVAFSISFQARVELSETSAKALFIYNFVKHVEWGTDVDPNSPELVIGVFDDFRQAAKFSEILSVKSIGSKSLRVIEANNAKEAGQCQVLFVPNEKLNYYLREAPEISGKGLLVITESPGMIKNYSGINLVRSDNKIQFEINERMLKKSGLKASNELLSLASSVLK